jgi:hypothetical protein
MLGRQLLIFRLQRRQLFRVLILLIARTGNLSLYWLELTRIFFGQFGKDLLLDGFSLRGVQLVELRRAQLVVQRLAKLPWRFASWQRQLRLSKGAVSYSNGDQVHHRVRQLLICYECNPYYPKRLPANPDRFPDFS